MEWFGPDTYAGGFDKTMHVYAASTSVHILVGMYEVLGVSRRSALLGGVALATTIAVTMEVVDGFTGAGFEPADAIANLVGLGLGVLTELSPTVDALVGLRLSYVPTLERLHSRRPARLTQDYSGMAVYLDLKLAGLDRFGLDPGFLRHFVVGPTYSTLGYLPRASTKRRCLGGYVGVDVAEVLSATLPQDSPAARAATTASRFYALPLDKITVTHDLSSSASFVGLGIANWWTLRL